MTLLRPIQTLMVWNPGAATGGLGLVQAALKQRLTVAAPEYVSQFQAAYGVDLRTLARPVVWGMAGRALAVYARAIVSRDPPFDRWNAGDDGATSAAGNTMDRGRFLTRPQVSDLIEFMKALRSGVPHPALVTSSA